MPQLDPVAVTYIASCTVIVYSLFLAYTIAREHYRLHMRRKINLYALRVTLHRAKLRQKEIFTITNFPHIKGKK